MKLTERLSNRYFWRGRYYRLRLSFDRVLLALDAFNNQGITDEQKIDIFCSLIIRRPPQDTTQRVELVTDVLEQVIMPHYDSGGENEESFDFEQDADYIYAAFWQTYHMDLIKERGRLDWRRFYALFLGLPENARFSEIISVRLRELPEPNEWNQKEIQAIRRAKRSVALKPRVKGQRFDSVIDAQLTSLFDYYRKKAGDTDAGR